MHPTTALYLANAHAADLQAEAVRARLAKSVRKLPDGQPAANWGLRLRRLVPTVHGKAFGATAA